MTSPALQIKIETEKLLATSASRRKKDDLKAHIQDYCCASLSHAAQQRDVDEESEEESEEEKKE